jgi:hypothetical protein
MNVQSFLDRYQRQLWLLTNYALQPYATFNDAQHSFKLNQNPFTDLTLETGLFKLAKNVEDAHQYRIGHPLAQRILLQEKQTELNAAQLTFYATGHKPKASAIEPYIGKSGWMKVSLLSIDSIEGEDYLLIAAQTDDGEWMLPEVASKLMELPANEDKAAQPEPTTVALLKNKLAEQKQTLLEGSESRNGIYFDDEMVKLEKWAEDRKTGLEIQIKDIDKQIRLYKSEARKVQILSEKVKYQREIKDLEKKRSELRQTYFTAQDDVDTKKENLIAGVEARLKQQLKQDELFVVKWKII